MILKSENKPWYADYRWHMVLLMLLAAIINYLDRVNLSMAITSVEGTFKLNGIEVGYLLSAWMWPYAFACLPAGWLIDRLGINKVFLWSIIVWSLATIAGGMATGFAVMYAARVLLGIAEAPFFIIGGNITRRYFSPEDRGLAASVMNTGPKIANGFAPPLLAAMMVYFGWRGMFIALGCAGLLLVVVWLVVYKKNDAEYVYHESRDVSVSKFNISYKRIINHPTSWWFNIGNFGTSYVFWLFFTWLPKYLMDARHMDLKAAGWLTSLPFVAGIVAVPLGGYISDLLIKRGMNPIKARLIPAVWGSLLAGLFIIPVNYVDNIVMAEILITLSTFCVSARVGVLWALVGDITPRDAVGTFGGIQNCANFVGGTLAPICTGYLLFYTADDYGIVFVVSGVICILGSLAYAMIRRPITQEEITAL